MILWSVEVDYADSLAVFLISWWIDDPVDTKTWSVEASKLRLMVSELRSQDSSSKFDHSIAEIADTMTLSVMIEEVSFANDTSALVWRLTKASHNTTADFLQVEVFAGLPAC